MKKIEFVNGTTIDGASTFNQMQDNIENDIGILSNLTTTEKSSLVGAVNEVKSGLGKIIKLNSSEIATKDVHTLNYNVNNFDFILVFATENKYGHFQMCTIIKQLLDDWVYQKIQYGETLYFGAKLYGTTLDTTNSTGLGENNVKITALYGVKL